MKDVSPFMNLCSNIICYNSFSQFAPLEAQSVMIQGSPNGCPDTLGQATKS